MPLAGPLKAWIAKCKAYAAQHGCSYKEAMSALSGKGKKSHRRKSHRGGGVADYAHNLEGAANMAGDTKPDGSQHAPPAPTPSNDAAAALHPAGQSGGGMASAFEVGAMSGMSGGRRRRRARGSKCRGSKRRGSRRNSRRRQSKRGGGGSLSYSDF